MPRREVTLGVVAGLVVAVCVAAGVWQLGRLEQRRARNARAAARLALPPVEVHAGLSADSARQRHVMARGVYEFAAERTWPGRSFEGTPGVALITPLRLADGSAVLVDRGWVPSPDAFHVDHAAYVEAESVRVEGIAFVAPRGRGVVDTTGFLPFIVQLEHPESQRLPRRWPTPVLNDGPHLSYAIQWFSFALIAIVGTVALIRKGR